MAVLIQTSMRQHRSPSTDAWHLAGVAAPINANPDTDCRRVVCIMLLSIAACCVQRCTSGGALHGLVTTQGLIELRGPAEAPPSAAVRLPKGTRSYETLFPAQSRVDEAANSAGKSLSIQRKYGSVRACMLM